MAQDYSANVLQSTNEASTRYHLDAKQNAQMLIIEARRERNLAEIETLKETDYTLYLKKKKAIRENTIGSVNKILNNEQRAILDQEKTAYRLETSDLIKQYKTEGKSKSEISLLLLERG